MSFVVPKSTFVRLSMFVTLVGLAIAQNILGNAVRGDFNFPVCGEGQFECQDMACIRNELLCDGRADCFDASDETEFECSKPELTCPDYTFRCKYGACIDRDLLCNGGIDCYADASDEDFSGPCRSEIPLGNDGQNLPGSNGQGFSTSNGQGFSTSNGQAFPAAPVAGGSYGGFAGSYDPVALERPCSVPPRPTNGQFKVRQISDNDDFVYIDPPSPELKPDSFLVYTCDPGYKIRGNPLVGCTPLGWARKPVCIEIRCRPLASVSMTGNCIHASGRVKPCTKHDPVRPKTIAELSCRTGYRKEFLPPQIETVECNEDGKWVPEPARCVPVCGVANPRQESITTGGTMINVSTFPWHAALYVHGNPSDGTESVFRCDATVIRANLLLTAAQCVHDFIESWNLFFIKSTKPLEILESYFITTRNTNDISLLHDQQPIKKHRVKNVHTTCSFQGATNLHASDIALIELHEPLEFSDRLLPVCLDEFGSIQEILEAGAYGGVSLPPESLRSRQVLQSTTVLEMPFSQCATLFNASRSPVHIHNEKFCDNSNYGIDSCAKDVVNDGGGLVFEMNNLWYLMGIVGQVPPTKNTNGGERSCASDFDLVYNKMSKHMTWIQQVISNLERFKYPPCSRYLPPFHTKPTTPVPTSTTTTTTTPMTNTTSSTAKPHVGSRLKAESCLVPPKPVNGEWKLHQDFCENDMDCSPVEGTTLGPGSQLVYSCAPGYRVEGNTDVYCRANGNWSSVPICTEIKCISLKSMSMTATCSRFGEWVNCNSPVFPNTQAKVSCRSGYRAQKTQNEILECNMNGYWEPTIPECVPVCGGTFGYAQLFLGGEITAVGYPWHATLYVEKNTSMGVEKEVRCGATLIQSNLLLTAAHCVYNEKLRTTEDPRKLFILMSNIHRHYDSPLHDFHSVRRGMVRNVHVHCNYHGLEGNYVADIALLELQDPFEFFNIQLHPACLDFSGYNSQVLEPGASGAFVGFGKTAIGKPSDVLQTITVPYVSQDLCKNSNIIPEKQVLIGNDKFCAGYNNGTAVCLGDGGGGLFVQINGLWFVMGVVSVDLRVDVKNGGYACDENSYTLYTNVTDYMSWILDVMFHLERYKSYPPCSNDPV